MVHTRNSNRASTAFQQDYPLFQALIAGDVASAALLCTPSEAAKTGHGNLTVLFLALLLGRDEHVLGLIAAGAPLDARLVLSYSDDPLRVWLAAAQLTDRAVRLQISEGRSALELALFFRKADQAKALIRAGASLQPLMPVEYGWWQTPAACIPLRDELRQFALAQSDCRLGSASAAMLGQVARLSELVGDAHLCLAALQAAHRRNMQLSTATAHAIIKQAAHAGHVGVTMHLVQHSPGSVWVLLQSYYFIPQVVAIALFPYLAELYVQGTLKLPRQECMCILVQRALSAGQPGPALAILHAVADAQQRRRRQPWLTPDDLVTLLRTAAATGCPEVVMHLVEQGVDVWSLLLGPQPVCGIYDEHRLIRDTVAAVLFPYLLQQYEEGRLEVSSKQLAALIYKASLHNQPDACLAMLRLSAARQVLPTEEKASGALSVAARQGQFAVVMALAEQLGSEVLWQLFDPSTHTTVMCQILRHLAVQLKAGALLVDSARLSRLVRGAARYQESGALTATLEAVRDQQLQSSCDDV